MAERVLDHVEYDRFLDCVHCGLCTSACPTYLETGDENNSPRGRIYLMRAVADGKLPLSDTVQRHLDLCLDCRSCETACPSGVQYGRLIEPFRAATQEQASLAGQDVTRSWFHRGILYGLFPYPNRMKWALAPARWAQRLGLDRLAETLGLFSLFPKKLRRMQRLLPPLPRPERALPVVLSAQGTKRARVGLFTGCVAEAVFSPTNRATARVLQANGCEVVVPPTQVCCGAIHYHSGTAEQALKFALQNVAAFPVDDLDAIIVNVAGCGSMLKEYTHIAEELCRENPQQQTALRALAGKMRDVSEFLMELGPVQPTGSLPLKATYHDACHLVHAQRIREQPRDLLELIPDLKLVPLAESDICCGAAGSYNLTEADMADRLAQRKLDNILASGAQVVLSANAGCTLQIQAAIRKSGKPLWTVHPIELLDLSYRNEPPPEFLRVQPTTN